jgi:2-amino-4-hydroxy-6-hydroxymethyldihydropteridine diphosphokinase
VLSQVLKIEKRLGRLRNKVQEYQSRTIDIDLIAFDSEIIATEKLEIPHPLMQNRILFCYPFKI